MYMLCQYVIKSLITVNQQPTTENTLHASKQCVFGLKQNLNIVAVTEYNIYNSEHDIIKH